MVNAWKPLGDRLQLVQSSKNGKNALDFHIAYFLGVLREQDVAASQQSICIVVTGDGGFDALFDFMRGRGCAVDKAGLIPRRWHWRRGCRPRQRRNPKPRRPRRRRHRARRWPRWISTEIVAGFASDPKSRPATRKKLEPYVLARLGNKVTPAVAQAVVKQLIKRGLVTFDGEKIKYVLPAAL